MQVLLSNLCFSQLREIGRLIGQQQTSSASWTGRCETSQPCTPLREPASRNAQGLIARILP